MKQLTLTSLVVALTLAIQAGAGVVTFDKLLAEDDFDRANSTDLGADWAEFVVGTSPWDDPGDTVNWSISGNLLAAGARTGDSSARMAAYYTGHTLGSYVDPEGRGETLVIDVRTSNWSGVSVNLEETSSGSIDPDVRHYMVHINGGTGAVSLNRARNYRQIGDPVDPFPGPSSAATIPGYSSANYYQYRVTTYPSQPGYVEAEIWSLTGGAAGGTPLSLLATLSGTDDGTQGPLLSGGYVGIASLYGGSSGQLTRADNLRIGIIPEPTSVMLLVAAGCGLLFRRRPLRR